MSELQRETHLQILDPARTVVLIPHMIKVHETDWRMVDPTHGRANKAEMDAP